MNPTALLTLTAALLLALPARGHRLAQHDPAGMIGVGRTGGQREGVAGEDTADFQCEHRVGLRRPAGPAGGGDRAGAIARPTVAAQEL